MTNEEAANVLRNLASSLHDGTRFLKPEHEQEFRRAYEMAIFALEQPEQKWIPVKDAMPEETDSIFARFYGTDRWRPAMFRKKSSKVIVAAMFEDGTYHTDIASTKDGEWYFDVKVVPKTVIAWMPLPAPYQERRTDEPV